MINENTLNFLDKISELTGSYAVVGVLIAGILLCIEVVARYLFNFPITWIPLVATEICAVVYFMVGAYTMLFKGHVAMDIFYERASKKRQALSLIHI